MAGPRERKVASQKNKLGDGLEPEERNAKKKEVKDDGDGSRIDDSDKANKKKQSSSQRKKIQEKSPERSVMSSLCSKAKYALLLIIVPPFLNYASLQREAVELKPPGELYDIGFGQKLFLSCRGKGPPTVVFDAPTGMSSDVWAAVTEKLSEYANVCIYDRAGLGFSERPVNRSAVLAARQGQSGDLNPSPPEDKRIPFTVERMADDLHMLLTSSSQQPLPLVLVGAELGAVVAQFYAHLFEKDVLGLVLVNPLPDDLFTQPDSSWAHHWFLTLNPTFQTFQLGAALGITRLGLLVGAIKQPITGDSVPEDVIVRQKHLMCHPRHLSSVVDEHHFINETLSQLKTVRLIKPLASNISVSVLTGNYYDEQMPSHLNKAWARAEQSLLTKYHPSAQHLVINGADRHVMYRKPEPIIEAVRKMVRRWQRSQGPMPSKSS